MKPSLLRVVIALLVLQLGLCPLAAQQLDTVPVWEREPAPENFVAAKRALGRKQAAMSVSKFEADQIAAQQNQLIALLKQRSQKAKQYIKSGIDTLDIHNEFRMIASRLEIAGDGVLTNKGATQTYRNLSTTYKIIYELLNRANAQKGRLDNYQEKLDNFMFEIDSLLSSPVLYRLPDDSMAIVAYLQKVDALSQETRPIDSMLRKAVSDVHGLQRQVNLDVNKLETSLDEIARYQANLAQRILEREFDHFGGQVGRKRPLDQILQVSLKKGEIILWFYTENNWGLLVLTLFVVASLAVFLYLLRRRMSRASLLHPTFTGQLVLKYPLLSSLLIVPNIIQFIFPAPPFLFSCIFWIVSALSLTILARNIVHPFWYRVWQLMGLLFLLACIDNLLLLASSIERTGIAFLAFAGVFSGVFILVKGRHKEPRERMVFFFVALMAFLELLSLIANFRGQYNLAKALLTGGYFNVVIGFMFLCTVRLLDQLLAIAYKFYIGQERKLFYINFERLGQKTPLLVYVALVAGWFTLVGRNFYQFKRLSDPFKSFLYSERTIGNATFSISSILVFFFIIGCSVVLSKIVSFFASDRRYAQVSPAKDRKAGVGSWLLLVRVAILVLGFLLAFAAAGLPMERITLVIGALGVGIGFGLQTLVNNLVSGLIIAFEKPVNVGDMVEINGQSGIVKSIGFRSSIISRWEGADLIIPNGDLLNAHLINWTLGGNKLRQDLALEVAYDTDLEVVGGLLAKALPDIEGVLAFPAPTVFFSGFGTNAIGIKVSFWVADFKEATVVRSKVLQAIHLTFKAHGIVIPIPQQELHIHEPRANAPDAGTPPVAT